MEVQQQPPPPPSCWSSIVKQTPQSKPPPPPPSSLPPLIPLPTAEEQTSSRVGSCNSAKGIAIAIVDANAIIQGGGRLAVSADRFISVPEVISEIRDPNSRHSLNLLPFTVDTIEPSPESLKKVITFARATGDLQTLSDVDLKLIALTYTMEAQIHGTQHLRESPPPIHTVNVKRLPEKELPGWGNNVPNLEEWEALEQAIEDQSNFTSRILPLKDLNLNVLPEDQSNGSIVDEEADNNGGRKYKKKEVKIDEKKIVIDGIDASQGQIDTNGDDWLPAVSRSTHRRFLRRKARRDISEVSSEKDTIETENENTESENKVNEEKSSDISTIMSEMKLNEESSEALEHGEDIGEDSDEELEDFEEESEIDTSNVDDNGSEQSWMLKSLSESSVACITSDFAMQNVLLQMGLRLLAPGGMQIRELNRWVLKCHACFKVTTDIGRIFCPSCGNGGTLRKVSVTVGENGIILAARKPRTSLRGTKFSLPSPQGGRDAITKNPVLREDQLPKKFLYPKTKKKNKGDDDMFASTDLFLHQNSEKRAPLQPPVRKALAVFSQRRNPNDNHYSRVMH